ncbi:MAG: ABC transporter ATP-binding protein [Armatimonadota bacterium]|nr:ABC transporter ATP-binding protein [Armatimonadota bacterium]MDR5676335.1 ABC transporter ATP-binding protein [Armatimonadota bacterium]MDR5690010.1 ABC transporter ATP-binding protein [Armatimonadota bacterium]MDR7389112.1 ABC transporter ATP-binding protein [Armatimonadota bacterium]MDR7391405.1 ABC transporter ATP-binding protein [Armatimonadota bacterium]
MSVPVLELRGVEAAYGDAQVLWGVDWRVQPGEVVAVVGPNGAGKSTTLRVVAGLLRPLRGEVWFDGTRIDGLPADAVVERGVALVPEGRRLFAHMTVLENLLLGGYATRARPLRRRTLEEVFHLFPVLGERSGQLAGTLSGGQQQMLAIARALMSRPRLLLLDEPSLGLAPVVVQQVYGVVARIAREGVTVVAVEQNVYPALQHAARGYLMAHGRVVAEGPAETLLRTALVQRSYVGG